MAVSAVPAPDPCKSGWWLPLWQQEGWAESAAHPGTFEFRPTGSWLLSIKAELAGQKPGGRPYEGRKAKLTPPPPLQVGGERRCWLYIYREGVHLHVLGAE